jgi:hypothetical protein
MRPTVLVNGSCVDIIHRWNQVYRSPACRAPQGGRDRLTLSDDVLAAAYRFAATKSDPEKKKHTIDNDDQLDAEVRVRRAIGAIVVGRLESRAPVEDNCNFQLSRSSTVVLIRMEELQGQETQVQDYGHRCLWSSRARRRREAQEMNFDRPLQFIAYITGFCLVQLEEFVTYVLESSLAREVFLSHPPSQNRTNQNAEIQNS